MLGMNRHFGPHATEAGPRALPGEGIKSFFQRVAGEQFNDDFFVQDIMTILLNHETSGLFSDFIQVRCWPSTVGEEVLVSGVWPQYLCTLYAEPKRGNVITSRQLLLMVVFASLRYITASFSVWARRAAIHATLQGGLPLLHLTRLVSPDALGYFL